VKTAIANNNYKIYCLKIVPLWGPPVYLTEYVRNLTMNGHVYMTDAGYEFTGLSGEAAMSPGTMDLSGIVEIGGASYDQIVSGVFDNARVYLFATTYVNPVEDEEPIGVAFVGKITLADARYRAELMMMIDVLNQATGKTYTAACQKKFGGQEFAGCKVALGPITKTGTITGVTSRSIFADSARDEPSDWFGEGAIAFTTGLNAGLKPMEIKSFSGDDAASGITAISNAVQATVEFTVNPYTYPADIGADIYFNNLLGMTELNGSFAKVIAIDGGQIAINADTSAYGVFTGEGTPTPGVFKLYEDMHYPVAIGDAYSVVPGCRKRLGDCKNKWNNVVNFGGFTNIPTSSQYTDRGLK
jgi:uncharacterized phage protein (TIGR02218 family)